ncbi:hypothetical protein GEV27_07565 [Aeromicrobium sp. S22]|uniref:nuclease-related domain-containing protein n=1 Tax=Aeromicrobium sp. S22 TaxID=2662029 RepID=UPI00129D9E7C|nr:nuclease-related domain-containing protein [Aeromicrobium sp. S22]MRK01380.1 hypothetical protein [Aeromicrobium sp. S22]
MGDRNSVTAAPVELNAEQLQVALGATGEELAILMRQLASERLGVDWSRMWRLLMAGKVARISPGTLQSLRAAVDATKELRFAEAARTEGRDAERQAALDAQAAARSAEIEADRALSRMKAEGERARKAELDSRNAQLKQRELEKKLRGLETQVERAEQKVKQAERSAAAAASTSRPSIRRVPRDQLRHPPLGVWQSRSGGSQHLHVAPPTTNGEVVLAQELEKIGHGLVVLNATIAVGSQEREVDALVILPVGIFTVEQKDTALVGTLEVPTNGPPTVDGRVMDGGDHRGQARKESQLLATLAAADPAIDIGFVSPMLSYYGDVEIATEQSGTVIVRRTGALADLFGDYSRSRRQTIRRPTVIDLLERLEAPGLPWDDIGAAGFEDDLSSRTAEIDGDE